MLCASVPNHHGDSSLGSFYFFNVYLVLGSPTVDTVTNCGLTSGKQRGITSSLYLLAMFLLMQAILLPTPGHTADLCSGYCPPWPFVLYCQAARFTISPGADTQAVLVYGVIPFQVQDISFLLMDFMRFLTIHFSSLSRALWLSALPSNISLAVSHHSVWEFTPSHCRFS